MTLNWDKVRDSYYGVISDVVPDLYYNQEPG